MSKFGKWLEEYFGIPSNEVVDDASEKVVPPISKKSTNFHVLKVQPTPNPNAFQFIINAPIIASGSKTFKNSDDAKGDSFAEAVFQIYGVESVYLKESFVTVTKSETIGWHTIFEKIGETIENKVRYYETHDEKKTTRKESETILDKFHKEDYPNCNEEQKTLIVEALLDQAIRPALANDGGGVDILSIEGNVIKVHYQGACGTCPSSTTGTLSYIESFLKDTLHPDLKVQAQ